MPYVGMRRITRVFGSRVLRSGKRLWTDSYESQNFVKSTDRANGKINDDRMDIIIPDPKIEEEEVKNVKSMSRIVYTRKRKREESKGSGLSEDKRFGKKFVKRKWQSSGLSEETRFGRKYVKGKWRKKCIVIGRSENCGSKCQEFTIAAIESSYESGLLIACFLAYVLNYMRRVNIGLERLSLFVRTKSVIDAYASRGVIFLRDSFPVKNPGVCVISRSNSLTPIFTVNFSAVPFCFLHLHSNLYLWSSRLASSFTVHRLGDNENVNDVINIAENAEESLFHISSELSKQNRNSINIDSSSSLKRKRGRPPLNSRTRINNGEFASEVFRGRIDNSRFSKPEPIRGIPIPGVQEVNVPFYENYVPYVRPDSYITVKNDELERALMRKTPNYDMDSDDDDWLEKFNRELKGGPIVNPDSFELIIDALVKGSPCNLDEHLHLERKEVVESVYKYWGKKRRKKCSALVQIFKLYKPKKSEVIPISGLRKKRSLRNRQVSRAGRGGKQRYFHQVISAEQIALERHKHFLKVQEAKASAERLASLAVLKRQRAQALMENADIITYKAIMALRIAEAAEFSKVPGKVASFFLE